MQTVQTKQPLRQIFLWTPRVLSLLFALFVGLFALDVFDEGYGLWKTVIALLIHLLPVFALLIGLALAWRWAWVGALIFLSFSVWYLATFWGRFPWSVYLIMAGVPFVVGLLWLVDWLYRAELRTAA